MTLLRLPAAGHEPAAAASAADRGPARAFLWLLGFTLVGYACFNKSFAYLGVAPLFIGEVTLLIGLIAAATCRTATLRRVAVLAVPLLAFMAWGAARTLPFVGEHGIDALRDGVLWGYGLFALAVAAVLLDEPQRLRRAVPFLKVYAVCFLVIGPVVMAGNKMLSTDHLGGGGLEAPWAPGVPLVYTKGGDIGVHLALVFGYLTLLGSLPTWLVLVTLPAGGLLMQSSRAAMVVFAAGVLPFFAYRPRHPLLWTLLSALLVGFVLLWASGFVWAPPGEKREFSAENIVVSVKSLFGDKTHEEMVGTKAWRMDWWTDIVNYTIFGEHFLLGKGYGISLADDDGYQVEFDTTPLRSPHNGHLTVLARGGVPGLALWVFANLAWLWVVFGAWLRSHRGDGLAGRQEWARALLWLMVAWGVYLLNASVDVFLEGPMGGVWFWCLFGAGLAAAELSRTHPELLVNVVKSDAAGSGEPAFGPTQT